MFYRLGYCYLYALALLSLFGFQNVSAYDDPIIRLDYGTFQGKYNAAYNITAFRKIPFGASTAGINRFRAPQSPSPIPYGVVYDTDQDFDMCPQRTVNGSEDCLYLGLYSRPWTSPNAKRPVLVTFYGGGFIQGSASFSIPPSAYPILNVTDSNDFVVVYPNYRTNAFGLLPGRKIKDSPTTDLNAGLLDQQAALKWVNKYIEHFGGDPSNVTIWGQSAGGGSVVAQVIANGGRTTPKLFTKALASSPFWPKTYRYDSEEAEALYTQLVELTGCNGAQDTLKCLKELDVQTIRNASLIISAENTYTTSSYTWAPVVDGEFIQQPLTEATRRGRVNAEFVFGMYNTHEGENFIPSGFGSTAGSGGFNSSVTSFNDWLEGFLPDFPKPLLDAVKELYPEKGSAENIPYYNTTIIRAGLVYRDLVLACPSYWIASAAKREGYLGEYTISPAKHASDTIYWNRINDVQKTQPLIYEGFAGAFGSFIQTGDPNVHKLTDATRPGVPNLRSGKEFVIVTDGFLNQDISMLEKRCRFWEQVGAEKQLPWSDYLFRYDHGGFWVGTSAFEYFKFPFNNFTSWWLDDFLHVRMMYTALHASGQSKQYVVQDLALLFSAAEQFINYTDKAFCIYPLWLCPLKQSPLPTMHPHSAETEADGQTLKPMHNIGLWGKGPSRYEDVVKLNRDLEYKLRELGGMKWLYAHTYYTESEFWEIYDREWYDVLREKYKATSLPSVYEKGEG